MASLCHFEVRVVLGALLDEVAMGRIPLACHFSLDVLCDKTSSLLVVNDNVSARNWPPSLPLFVVTECANDGALTAENESALMQYAMDGSTSSFICPFLDLPDTFNMRTTATAWNSAAKYSYFSCCMMHLDTALTQMYRWTVQFGGYRNVVRRHQNSVTRWGISQDGGPGSVEG